MAVITEHRLRALFREKSFSTFTVEPGQIMTPSATEFLRERRVKVEMIGKSPVSSLAVEVGETGAKADQLSLDPSGGDRVRYVSVADGGHFDVKPEHMTQLKGNRLVCKDHPRIALRGKLDSFQSAILVVQGRVYELGKISLVGDLEEILNRVREIMKAEVLEQSLIDETLLGFSSDQLREVSHNPKKYFGINHLLPDYTMGPVILELNQLRSSIREVEVAAVKAFHTAFNLERRDILEALNRMSSALYIMMLKEKSGNSLVQKPGQ